MDLKEINTKLWINDIETLWPSSLLDISVDLGVYLYFCSGSRTVSLQQGKEHTQNWKRCIKAFQQTGGVVHICNPSTWEAEGGGSQV
jgi:hypothetical protein